ncbi:unnamed protein product [Lymnaea stagnalis]|uniref:THD domain-containing protein n=1 Tax=Lymnaea stagnalis TaxID=6523 RepID=A0AAV2I5M4_LYMST
MCLALDPKNQPHEYTNGVTVTPHSLVITFSGLYYIYCSVCFHQDVNAAKITNSVAYVHRVSPYNPGGTGVLLKSVHNAFHKTSETTFTGGIFSLREGDRLQVCVIDSDGVDFKSESTYTGLFLLTGHQARDDAFPD